MLRALGAAACLLLCRPGGAFAKEEGRIGDILAEIERLAVSEEGAHPLDVREAEARIRGFIPEIRGLGAGASAPLCSCLQDKARPLKVRLYAAAFLGLLGDPGAFLPLKARALDAAEDPGLRSAALQSLGGLRVKPHELRGLLERAALDPDSPEPVRREALAQLSRIGASSIRAMSDLVQGAGRRLEGPALADAAHAVGAIALSRDQAAVAALFELLGLQRRGSGLKTALVQALLGREDLGELSALRLEVVTSVLREEGGPAAFLAARLLGKVAGGRADEALAWAAKSAEPSVAAEAASILENERREREAKRPRPVPVFRYEGWPGEGTPRLVWNGAARKLVLRAEPERSSAGPALRPGKGEILAYDGSAVITRTPGVAFARKELEFSAMRPGGEALAVRVSSGQPVEILAYRAEGRCFLKRYDTVFLAECPQNFPDRFELAVEPRTEWWLHLSSGAVSGWFQAEQDGIGFLPRTY